MDLSFFKTDFAVPNSALISFAEAKHMSGYAELIAGFLGLVHELLPKQLKVRKRNRVSFSHVFSSLHVSGILYSTAEALVETIKNRKYGINVFYVTNKLE
jgi:hypothetical protein